MKVSFAEMSGHLTQAWKGKSLFVTSLSFRGHCSQSFQKHLLWAPNCPDDSPPSTNPSLTSRTEIQAPCKPFGLDSTCILTGGRLSEDADLSGVRPRPHAGGHGLWLLLLVARPVCGEGFWLWILLRDHLGMTGTVGEETPEALTTSSSRK